MKKGVFMQYGLCLIAMIVVLSGCAAFFPEGIDCKFGEGCSAKNVSVTKDPGYLTGSKQAQDAPEAK